MGTPACCCCISGNVRHLVLLLSTLCITLLFANVVLFGLTTVIHDEGELSAGLRTVDSTVYLHSVEGMRRLKRFANDSDFDDGKPIIAYPDTNIMVSSENATDEGRPVITHEIPEETTTTTDSTTKARVAKPKLVLFTNPLIRSSTASPSFVTSSTRTGRRSTDFSGPEPTQQADSSNPLKSPPADKDSPSGEDPVGKSASTEDVDRIQKEPKQSPRTVAATAYPTRALVYAAPGIGVLLGTLPATELIRLFGSRKAFFAAMLLSAFATGATPFLMHFGFAALFILRFVTGVALSFALPLAGAITANWGTLKEQLTFIAVIFLFVPWAPIFSWNLAMLLYSNSVEVKYIYLTHAGFTVFLGLIFVIFHRNKPQYHNWVNGIELNKIVAGKVQELKNNRMLQSPLSTLLRSISAWAIWVAMFGFFIVVSLFCTFLPTFFANVDVWLVDYIGMYGSLPFLGIPACYLLSGLGNRSVCCRSTTQVRIWNTLSFCTTGLLMVIFPVLFASEEGSARNVMLLLSLAPLGLVMAGALRSVTLVGRFYAQHILSYMGVSLGLAMTLTPFGVLALVSNNELTEWLRVFILSAGLLSISAVAFAVFGRGRSAGWAEHSWDPSQTHKMRTLDPIDVSRDECGMYEMTLIGPGSK